MLDSYAVTAFHSLIRW